MKIAIMQPYFFPYLGYWQLINAVDKFVLLDDVNYIMRGFINRNSILVNGGTHKFSISIDKPSQNKLINETILLFPTKERHNFLKTIEMAYKKAPFFSDTYPVIEESVMFDDTNLLSFLKHSICITKDHLGIDSEILVSSEIKKDNSKKAQNRIIEINKIIGSNTYINPIGGQQLYKKEDFKNNGIELYFMEMQSIEYRQFQNTFVPNLSIIDVLMFNSINEIKDMLLKYRLV